MSAGKSDPIDKLREAIQALEAQRAVLGDAVVATAIEALREQITKLEESAQPVVQQRKVATILFADVVGHTEMVQNLDPEDNLAIMENAMVRMATVVEAHGGRIVRYQGDGFKAIFGLPAAQESDPENAIRAGIELIEMAQEYDQTLELERGLTGFNVRVGIDTGLVIAGGITEGEDSITGLVVNLAARLESVAPPGGVLISHHTYQHVRGVFNVERQEPVQVKGFADPVQVYLVKQAKPRAFRLGRRGVEGIETKTIGREKELRQLQLAFQTAAGQNQTTFLTLLANAGLGKSRILFEFEKWLELRSELIRYFKGRATQQTQGTPQYLLRDMLGRRFQILDSDPLTTVREKFSAGISEYLPDQSEMKAHILGTWLGYDFKDSQHLKTILDEPQQIKNRATLYLAQFFSAICAEYPAVVMLDDIHWADGGSLDSMLDLVRRQPDLPLLVVCLARPSIYDRRPEWGKMLPAHIQLDLAPLSGEDSRALVVEILRLVDSLPDDLLNLVASRGEGNPFYSEELVKMLIDDGVIVVGAKSWQVMPERFLELRVPPTLTGVLQARLDMLRSQEKRAAQQAAVIGRIFWDQALAALEAEAVNALPTLRARELIYPRDESAFAGTAEYIFKHALLRDVAYETVLKRMRRLYHAQAADWLATTAAANGREEEYASVIGEHYQRADNLQQAADWYGRAGDQAARTHAYEAAVRYLSLALDFTPAEKQAAFFALLKTRENAYHMQGNRKAQREDLAQLVLMASRLGEIEQGRMALRQAKYTQATSEYAQAVIHAQEAIKLGQRMAAPELVVDGHLAWGRASYRQSQYAIAHDQFQTGLELAQELVDWNRMANCLTGLGNVAADKGDFANAKAYYEQSLTIAQEMDDQGRGAASLNGLGIVAHYQGDFSAAKDYYERSLAIQSGIGNRFGEGVILSNLGLVAENRGDLSTARAYYEHSLTIRREIDDRYGEGGILSNLGFIVGAQGDYTAADEYLEQALTIQREVGDQWGEGISLNELGAVALAQDNLQKAESCYQLALSSHQEMDLIHYKAEDWAGLARVKLAQGDMEVAQTLGLQVLDYLRENNRLEGAENPMRALHLTWEVFIALGQTTAADEVLAFAVQIIQAYLQKNTEPAAQEMYLNQVHHAELWAAWRT